MSDDLATLWTDFLPQFLRGMAVNFEIAVIALAIGLVLGVLLGGARLHGRIIGRLAVPVLGVMRAAPTFVVMFFLLNAIPADATLFGLPVALSGVMTVALSLVPYAAAYIADNGVDALQLLRRGSPLGALLFLPNLARVFFVLVMSSSTGAAIGVTEGIAVILQHAEHLSTLGEKLVLFAIGIACFGVLLQTGFGLVKLLQWQLGRMLTRGTAV